MSDNSVNKTSSTKNEVRLVSPMALAYRLVYLFNQQPVQSDVKQGGFFRITRRSMEKLAVDRKHNDNDPLHKAPISEAYIAYTIYELECIGCCLVKVDREYLVGTLASLKKLKKLATDNDKVNTLLALPWNNLKQAVQASLNKNSSDNKSSLIEKKAIEEGDEQQVLLCIWQALLKHLTEHVHSSTINGLSGNTDKIIPLTYKSLCNRLPYQLHQNGLASYLYSIKKYCEKKKLPRLDYLVVKEGTRLPDGVLATDSEAVMDFHAQLEEIVAFVKKEDSCFQAEPLDLKFEKKPRAKKASRKQVTYTPLTGE